MPEQLDVEAVSRRMHAGDHPHIQDVDTILTELRAVKAQLLAALERIENAESALRGRPR